MDGDFPPGEIEATPCGGGTQGLVCGSSNNANTVLVNIATSSGTADDHAFYLMVVG